MDTQARIQSIIKRATERIELEIEQAAVSNRPFPFFVICDCLDELSRERAEMIQGEATVAKMIEEIQAKGMDPLLVSQHTADAFDSLTKAGVFNSETRSRAEKWIADRETCLCVLTAGKSFLLKLKPE